MRFADYGNFGYKGSNSAYLGIKTYLESCPKILTSKQPHLCFLVDTNYPVLGA